MCRACEYAFRAFIFRIVKHENTLLETRTILHKKIRSATLSHAYALNPPRQRDQFFVPSS